MVWGCCKAPEALRSSGRRQAHCAQPLCRGERSPIHRAPEGRKSVGQWVHFFIYNFIGTKVWFGGGVGQEYLRMDLCGVVKSCNFVV